MTPQLEARAFAIWRYAAPLKWDCTHAEIARATGLSCSQIRHAIHAKGWGGRIAKWGHSAEAGAENLRIGNAASHKSRGHRVDENELDLLQLMGA